jgi:hypothetical protein
MVNTRKAHNARHESREVELAKTEKAADASASRPEMRSREKHTRHVAVAGIVVIVPALAGCGGDEQGPTVVAIGTQRIGTTTIDH